jgi:hypothetical protein
VIHNYTLSKRYIKNSSLYSFSYFTPLSPPLSPPLTPCYRHSYLRQIHKLNPFLQILYTLIIYSRKSLSNFYLSKYVIQSIFICCLIHWPCLRLYLYISIRNTFQAGEVIKYSELSLTCLKYNIYTVCNTQCNS